ILAVSCSIAELSCCSTGGGSAGRVPIDFALSMSDFAVSPPATVGIRGAICWPKLGAANHTAQKHAARLKSEKWKILLEPQVGKSIETLLGYTSIVLRPRS